MLSRGGIGATSFWLSCLAGLFGIFEKDFEKCVADSIVLSGSAVPTGPYMSAASTAAAKSTGSLEK